MDEPVNRQPAVKQGSTVMVVTKSRLDGDVEVSSYVAGVAARLNERLAELSSGLDQFLEEQIPELRGDEALMELLGTSVEANVHTVLHALRHDIVVERVEAPTAALEYARRLAQHGVPVHALVRAYQIGQRRLHELVFAEVMMTDLEPAVAMAVVEKMSTTMFGYIAWISQQVVEVYEQERERWLENQNTIRAVRVREILASKTVVDVEPATSAIRYP